MPRSRPSRIPEGTTLRDALERMCFLEWRLEQQEAALTAERRLVDDLRVSVAEGAGREATAADRIRDLEQRLADARREAALLGERLSLADGTRSSLEDRIHSADERSALDVARMSRELLVERQRAEVKSQALSDARTRLSALEQAHERFYQRLIGWQHDLAGEGTADLAEFISQLRAEIMRLSEQNDALIAEGEARESELAELALDPSLLAGPSWGGTVAPEPLRGHATQAPEFAATALPFTARAAKRESKPAEATEELSAEATGSRTPIGKAHNFGMERLGNESPGTVLPTASGKLGLEDARAALAAVQPPERRRQALRLLSELLGPTPGLRLVAARNLLSVAKAHAAAGLVAALDLAADDEERAALIELVGKSGAAAARFTAASALDDPSATVRGAALDAALRLFLGSADAEQELLRRGLADPDPRVRRRAILSATSVRAMDPTGLWVSALDDADPHTRRAACAALATRPGPRSQRALLGAISDASPLVRRAAAQALAPTLGRQVLELAEREEVERRRGVAALRSERIGVSVTATTGRIRCKT